MDIAQLQRNVERVSAQYAEDHGIARTDDWLILKLGEEVGELTQAYLARSGQARDKGRTTSQLTQDFGAEISDVLAHLLLIAHRFEIDVEAEVVRKWFAWLPSPPAS